MGLNCCYGLAKYSAVNWEQLERVGAREVPPYSTRERRVAGLPMGRRPARAPLRGTEVWLILVEAANWGRPGHL